MTPQSSVLTQLRLLVPEVVGTLTALAALGFVLFFGSVINSSLPESVGRLKVGDLVAITTVIAAFITVYVTLRIHRNAQSFNESNSYLVNSIDLINKAKSVLTLDDGRPTSDRIAWVTAARLLSRSQSIASLISIQAHKRLYEAEHDYQRHDFGELLRSLPPAFFLGQIDPTLTIGQAALAPGAKGESTWIPERIIAVVYRFFEYPEGYDDPLDVSGTKFSLAEIRRLELLGEAGVAKYLRFCSKFTRIGHTIRRKPSRGHDTLAVTANEIDAEVSRIASDFE